MVYSDTVLALSFVFGLYNWFCVRFYLILINFVFIFYVRIMIMDLDVVHNDLSFDEKQDTIEPKMRQVGLVLLHNQTHESLNRKPSTRALDK